MINRLLYFIPDDLFNLAHTDWQSHIDAKPYLSDLIVIITYKI